MQNFIRQIPDKILELKYRADELELFDNYVILHYFPFVMPKKITQIAPKIITPEINSSAIKTKEQIRKEKDSILFGLIEGGRKLYFIGDWVDEICDLTLEQLVDHLGKQFAKDIINV